MGLEQNQEAIESFLESLPPIIYFYHSEEDFNPHSSVTKKRLADWVDNWLLRNVLSFDGNNASSSSDDSSDTEEGDDSDEEVEGREATSVESQNAPQSLSPVAKAFPQKRGRPAATKSKKVPIVKKPAKRAAATPVMTTTKAT